MVKYTDYALTTDVKRTVTPRHNSATGYGGKIPTPYMVRYAERWRRVYAMVYGNGASCYIIYKSENLFLDLDTEYDLEEYSTLYTDTYWTRGD